MKIRNVEVRTKSFDSGSSCRSLDDLSADDGLIHRGGSHDGRSRGNRRTNSNTSSSHHHNNVDVMQEAVTSLSVAMKELHTELRDKTGECEAMYETASALSRALQESERLLTEKTAECERLQMKLQMVTFREVDDDPRTMRHDYDYAYGFTNNNATTHVRDAVEEAEELLAAQEQQRALLSSSEKHSQAAATQRKKKPAGKSTVISTTAAATTHHLVDLDEVVDERAPSSSSASATTTPLGPVCVDDGEDDDDSSSSSSTGGGGGVLDSGPRQAHFYQVIQERDKALQSVKKLSREVKHARAKNKELKSKLERSTTLNELAYFKQEVSSSSSSSGKQQQSRKKSKRSTAKHPQQQLQQQARPPRQHSLPPPETEAPTSPAQRKSFVFAKKLVEDDNDNIPSRPWASLRRKASVQPKPQHNPTKLLSPPPVDQSEPLDIAFAAAADHEYLKAVASNDADRAGGYSAPVARVDL